MVAMFGRIMPAPLLMPVTVMVTPSCWNWRLAPLGRVSVVMMPVAAAAQLSTDRSSSAACSAPSIFSTGSGSPITPVEYGSTGWHPRRPARPAWRRCARRGQARLAGAGVGIAGVGQQVAHRACTRCLARITGGAESVEGEHAGDRRAFGTAHHHHILAPRALDAGRSDTEFKTGNRVQRGQRTKTNSHECAP
jgi:hypothetical protein